VAESNRFLRISPGLFPDEQEVVDNAIQAQNAWMLPTHPMLQQPPFNPCSMLEMRRCRKMT
jgi:hypothetical protein